MPTRVGCVGSAVPGHARTHTHTGHSAQSLAVCKDEWHTSAAAGEDPAGQDNTDARASLSHVTSSIDAAHGGGGGSAKCA